MGIRSFSDWVKFLKWLCAPDDLARVALPKADAAVPAPTVSVPDRLPYYDDIKPSNPSPTILTRLFARESLTALTEHVAPIRKSQPEEKR